MDKSPRTIPETKVMKAQTLRFDIYMAGNIEQAKRVLSDYAFKYGACFHIHPVDYVFTGGEEAGFKIGIINYPRFNRTKEELEEIAESVGLQLMVALYQNSFTVVGPEESTYFTRKPEDQGV